MNRPKRTIRYVLRVRSPAGSLSGPSGWLRREREEIFRKFVPEGRENNRREGEDGIKSGSVSFNLNFVLAIASDRSATKRTSVDSVTTSDFKIEMFFKIRSCCVVFAVVIFLILAMGSDAQLNFSTGWGKRSPQTAGTLCTPPGKPSFNQLVNLYNLIQNEAQRMLDCQKFVNK